MHFPLVYVVFEIDCYSGSKRPCNHTNVVYNSYLYISNVIAICGDFDGQPYTVEIGVAYDILLHGLAAWLQTVTNCDLSYNYHNTTYWNGHSSQFQELKPSEIRKPCNYTFSDPRHFSH